MDLPGELEAAIRAAPDDRAVYLVAGDWLLEHGDPQGELIAVALAAVPDEARLWDLEATLDPIDDRKVWRRVYCDWRWGFVRSARMTAVDDPDELLQLRTVLDAPAARFVRELVISGISQEAPIRVLRDAVAARPALLGCLTSLVLLGDPGGRLRERSLRWLWSAAPRLERLMLGLPHLAEPNAFPALRELVVQGGVHDLIAILDSAWPVLETLRLAVDGPAEPLLRWLTRARFPGLRRLAIAASGGVDAALWQRSGAALGLQRLEVAGHDGVRRFPIDDRTGRGRCALLSMGGRWHRAGTLTPIPDGAPFAIGRDADSDLVLETPAVAGRHAFLRPGPTGWLVDDLGRNQGVWVNGADVAQVLLRSGDELALAGEVLRFVEGEQLEAEVAALRARFALP